jgi:23S rRNA (adenine-N6)-dimethyltransferase
MPRTSRHHAPLAPEREVAHSQNFLTSRGLVERLVERAAIGPDTLVVEVGAGRGIITEALARRAGRVVAVEKDAALAERLARQFAEHPNVRIVSADFLDVPLPRERFVVFASLPFNATSEIVSRLLAAPEPPDDMHLVVQREAAERFAGRPRASLVAILLAPWFEPSIVHRFRRHDFSPAPRVDVVMLRLCKRGPPLVQAADARLFRDFLSYAFTAWQPSLASTLDRLVGRVPFELWLRVFQALKAGDRARLGARLAGAEQQVRRQQRALQKIHRTRTRWTRRPPPGRLIA